MRPALLFLLGVILGACAHPADPPAAPKRPDVDALVSKTVALVVSNDDGDVSAYCSGVWIGNYTFATANHCVGDAALVEYVTHDDVYAPADLHVHKHEARAALVLATDLAHDLALAQDPAAPTHQVAHLALNSIDVGAHVQKMGHGLGLWWTYAQGDIAALRLSAFDGETVWIQATTPVTHGDSGCGLFDADGGLLGLLQGSFPRGQNLNMFVHGQYLAALLIHASKVPL